MTQKLCSLFLSGLLMLALSACATSLQYSAEPIEAWVVDAETKQPLEGVIVVAHWQLHGGLHPDNAGELTILETLTDKVGRFHFPAWGPKPLPAKAPSNARLLNDDPQLLLFKPDYKYKRLNNLLESSWSKMREPQRRSDWNGKTIKMEKFGGTDMQAHYKNLLNFSKEVDSFATWHIEPCQWTNLPIAVNKMMQERKKLEAQGARSVMGRTLDRRLLEGEPYFIKDCGPAARTFIEEMKK